MTGQEAQSEREIFRHAVEVPPDQRAAYLEQACGDNVALRQEVESLLHAHDTSDIFMGVSFLERRDDSNLHTALMPPLSERPGTVIGRYKLMEQIGEGGFGLVFVAEQHQPVRRKVALKIIKPGMDTRDVIARFEAERQALALMDHPNIAKVFDAGATESGRPYFAMELVRGVPITDYCDQRHLTPRERLELFTSVCQAIQHAHQKGIIHRDVKPTNVLVTLHDGVPVVKVIDFGVAKALSQQLTERTIYTQFAQMLGTPLYMSPEQAEMSGLDIDTRSDIYSLGVLLYELLTGTTPFDRRRLNKAATDEIRRILCEEEPPKPSTRIGQSGDRLPSIASRRGTEPAKLSKLIRGDLDWIVMKCLEKDRTRRYETANDLARDIERYLHDKPVVARPPSTIYRFGKFARRNKGRLIAASVLVLALLVATGSVGWAVRGRAAQQAEVERQRTERHQRVTAQVDLILADADRLMAEQNWPEALAAVKRAQPLIATGEVATPLLERARRRLAHLEFVHQLEDIRTQSGSVWGDRPSNQLDVWDEAYGKAFREFGIDLDSLPLSDAVEQITACREIAAAMIPAIDDWVAVRSQTRGPEDVRRLADVLRIADPDPWRQRVRDALASKDWAAVEELAQAPEFDRQPAATLYFLGAALHANPQASALEIEVLRRAQWNYPADYWINHRLGVSLIWRKSPAYVEEGIGYVRAAVALQPGKAHPIMNLGTGYRHLQKHDEAVACYRKAIELAPRSAEMYYKASFHLGYSLRDQGKLDEAIAVWEEAIHLQPDHADSQNDFAWFLVTCEDPQFHDPVRAVALARKALEQAPKRADCWNTLGVALYRVGDWQAAIRALNKSMELAQGGDSMDWFFLAMAKWQTGNLDEARLWYDEAIDWMEKNDHDNEELVRFRAEAAELLGLPVAAIDQSTPAVETPLAEDDQ